MQGLRAQMKRLLLSGIAALFLATGTAHTIEYQGKLPKPVQRLPSYPPVVCVAPNWAAEPCEDRQPQHWLVALSDLFKWLDWIKTSWVGAVETFDQPRPWIGKWPDEVHTDDDNEDDGGFPKEVRGLWCLSPSESTETKLILNPATGADVCKPDEGVILISYSQFYGPNGRNNCALDTKTKMTPAREILEPERMRSSAVYHVHLRCFKKDKSNWTDFLIHHNAWDNGDEELVIRPSTQG
jgi:hypothetical protein